MVVFSRNRVSRAIEEFYWDSDFSDRPLRATLRARRFEINFHLSAISAYGQICSRTSALLRKRDAAQGCRVNPRPARTQEYRSPWHLPGSLRRTFPQCGYTSLVSGKQRDTQLLDKRPSPRQAHHPPASTQSIDKHNSQMEMIIPQTYIGLEALAFTT